MALRGINMKFQGLKRYMAQDLIVLVIIGGILEVFVTKYATVVFNGAPFMCVSLLIVFLAVARWNLWGLVVAPIMSVLAMLGGMWSESPAIAKVYDWHMFLATTVGLLAIGFNVILFRKVTTKKVVSSYIYLALLMLLDYVVVCGIQFLVYRLACAGTLTHSGEIVFTYMKKGADGIEKVVTENVCFYGENMLVFNLFSLAILFVGAFILRSQGILCNVKQRFIDDKKNAELDNEFNKFVISETEEEVSGEAESEKIIEEAKTDDSNHQDES